MLHPLIGRELHHDAISVGENKWCGKHRQDHGRQYQLHQIRIDQPESTCLIQQHKAEFTALCQTQAGAQRNPRRCAKHSGKQRDQAELDEQGHYQQH